MANTEYPICYDILDISENEVMENRQKHSVVDNDFNF